MKPFNLLVATNEDLVAFITQIVVAAYLSERISKLPEIDPDDHFEHQEAKITIGLFDGPIPDAEEFERIRKQPESQRPRYHRDIYRTATNILDTFFDQTGKLATEDMLSMRDRARLWTLTMEAILPAKGLRRTRSR